MYLKLCVCQKKTIITHLYLLPVFPFFPPAQIFSAIIGIFIHAVYKERDNKSNNQKYSFIVPVCIYI